MGGQGWEGGWKDEGGGRRVEGAGWDKEGGRGGSCCTSLGESSGGGRNHYPDLRSKSTRFNDASCTLSNIKLARNLCEGRFLVEGELGFCPRFSSCIILCLFTSEPVSVVACAVTAKIRSFCAVTPRNSQRFQINFQYQ